MSHPWRRLKACHVFECASLRPLCLIVSAQAPLRGLFTISKPNRRVFPARIAAVPFSRVCDCLSCLVQGHSDPWICMVATGTKFLSK
ncbi:hypothetical protein CGRA01v4_03678 [Colletotrichum graminicola]|nr:hypothetical protein CGRA01v4_03678 [Colletotrichum graminicola]